MKKIIKIIFIFSLLIMMLIAVVILDKSKISDVSYASGSNASDIQLMARAKIIKIIFIFSLLIMMLIAVVILDKSKISDVSYASGSNASDIQLMARAINGEARGEPNEGQVAVGAVILNRVKNSQFPNTVAGVIYQSGAFTAVSDGQINVPIEENSSVYKAARDAMNGWDPTGGCIYYFNPSTATNKWIWSRPLVKVIGKHRFCK